MRDFFRYFVLLLTAALLYGCVSVAEPGRIDIRASYAAQPRPTGEINLVSWNIGKENLAHPEFVKFTERYSPDIFCLQEATALTCGEFGRSDFDCCFAPSWKSAERSNFTGVLTLSRFDMACPHKILSPDKEFLFLTPKAALFSTVTLPDGQTLAIINVHILTFSCLRNVRRQYDRIYEIAKSHTGPMIVCGDFNTWNGSRIKAAQQFAAKLGLVEALAYHETGGTPSNWFMFIKPFIAIELDAVLDRIFFRGFEMIEFRRHPENELSDHPPLSFRGRLLTE